MCAAFSQSRDVENTVCWCRCNVNEGERCKICVLDVFPSDFETDSKRCWHLPFSVLITSWIMIYDFLGYYVTRWEFHQHGRRRGSAGTWLLKTGNGITEGRTSRESENVRGPKQQMTMNDNNDEREVENSAAVAGRVSRPMSTLQRWNNNVSKTLTSPVGGVCSVGSAFDKNIRYFTHITPLQETLIKATVAARLGQLS